MKALFTTLALVTSSSAFAAPFTVPEMLTAAEAAVDEFEVKFGPELLSAVYGIETKKTAAAGRVKIFYKDGATDKSVEFFCHYHSAAIDCHAL